LIAQVAGINRVFPFERPIRSRPMNCSAAYARDSSAVVPRTAKTFFISCPSVPPDRSD
jgi:hypothetical protein